MFAPRKKCRDWTGRRSSFSPLVLLWICGLIFSTFDLQAQEPTFRHFTPSDGLPGNTVYDLFQDDKGYIWMGTSAGVGRFDGLEFETFTTGDGLGDNEVFKLRQDSQGRIWTLTYNGRISFFDRDSIKNAGNARFLNKLNSDSYFSDFLEDSKGRIWLGTKASGVFSVNPDETVNHFEAKTPMAPVTSIWEDSGSIRLAGKFGVLKLQGDDFVETDSLWESHGPIRSLYYGKNQILAGQGRNLSLYEGGVGEYLEKKSWEFDSEITLLQKARNGSFWVGTRNGVYLFESFGNAPKVVYLRGYSVTSVLEDRENNLWFATEGGGVFFLSSRKVFTYTQSSGLFQNEVMALKVDGEGTLWVGYRDYTFEKWYEDGRFERARIDVEVFGNTNIRDFHFVNGDSWVVAQGAWWAERDNRISTGFGPMKEVLPREGKRTIWGGGGAIWTLRDSLDEFLPYVMHQRENINHFPIGYVHTMLDGVEPGTFFVGTIAGLYLMKDEGMELVDTLLPYRISGLALGKDRALWVSTYGWGVYRFKDGKKDSLRVESGLSSNICQRLRVDEQGEVWVATIKGLDHLVETEGGWDVHSYGLEEGLASPEINDVARIGNKVWVATNEGLTVFDYGVSENEGYGNPVEVYLTGLWVNDSLQPVREKISLGSSQNNLKVSWVGISFRLARQLRYEYRMVGLDDGWQRTANRSVQYPTLPPGTYELQVRVAAMPGGEPGPITSLHLSVAPHFWQTIWFYLIIAALIVCSVLAILYAIRKRDRRRAEMKLAIARAEQTALRAQMNPHFIFNALNSIQKYILTNDKTTAYNYLEKFSRLIRMTLEHSRLRTVKLSEEVKALELYLELEALRFADKFEYSLTVDPEIPVNRLRIPGLLIQPYVENALRHGLMPLRGKGNPKLEIRISRQNESLRCEVEDNGIGRAASRAQKQKSALKRSSMGMELTENRLELAAKELGGNSKLLILDRKNEDGTAAGTTVILEIPIVKQPEDEKSDHH